MSVRVRVPAKINLTLSVGPLRPDGYHDLMTLFQAVSLFDVVEVHAADELRVAVHGRYADEVPHDASNLAERAARALAAHAGVEATGHLRVTKEIPVAAGLAGGSADAGGALIACARLWGLDASPAALLPVAAEVGSDVPFALLGGAAVGQGRGERLTPVEAAQLHWVLAVAPFGLSTPEVFRRFDALSADDALRPPATGSPAASPPETDAELLAALRSGDLPMISRHLSNDLLAPALMLRPELAETLEHGTRLGAVGAVLSGSGPTCAFLATDAHHAAELAAQLQRSELCRDAVAVSAPTHVVVD